MPTHRMHLRGPWQVVAPGSSGDNWTTKNLPQEWRGLFGATAGTATFLRAFHCPTNLDPEETVAIVLTEVGGSGRAYLNEELLGEFPAGLAHPPQFDVTQKLLRRNHLRIEVEFDPDAQPGLGGLYGLVAIEIASPP
ncbi:MAG: hypothetical protein SFV23_23730 [Planctomycetaceae bacterium]|nr:hypothetical protein [Planctomycetaceae bacterium]